MGNLGGPKATTGIITVIEPFSHREKLRANKVDPVGCLPLTDHDTLRKCSLRNWHNKEGHVDQSLSVNQTIYPSFRQSVSPSVRQSVSPSVSQSVRQSVSPSVNQSVSPQSVSPSVNHYQSVSPSLGQSVRLSSPVPELSLLPAPYKG